MPQETHPNRPHARSPQGVAVCDMEACSGGDGWTGGRAGDSHVMEGRLIAGLTLATRHTHENHPWEL